MKNQRTTTRSYTYVIRDHLGNNRVFFWDSTGNNSLSTNEIRAVKSYYPFGMDMRQTNNTNKEFTYGFGNKEELEYTGYLAFGARCMDASTCRWTSLDPMADDPSNHAWSPFCAMWTNPINVIDPMGAFNEYLGTISKNGEVSYQQIGDKGADQTDYIKYVDAEGNHIDNVTVKVQTVNIAYGEMYQGTIDRLPGLNIVNTGTGGAITPVPSPIDFLFAKAAAKTTFGILRRLVSSREKTQEHHSDPKFLGGNPNQHTTTMGESLHRALHSDLNNYLVKVRDKFGNHMRPQRGNSGAEVRQNFSRDERLKALSEFYTGTGKKYHTAARNFFKQHPNLRP